jgi:hypothetical protein
VPLELCGSITALLADSSAVDQVNGTATISFHNDGVAGAIGERQFIE